MEAISPSTCRGTDPHLACLLCPQRDAPELMQDLPPEGRGECRVPSAPAASCAHGVVKMHTSIHSGRTGNHPASPHAMVLTVSFALSLVTGLFCHHRRRSCLHRLDASIGASGPHDFAVRFKRRSSVSAKASTASRPASVTIAIRPLCGTRRWKYAGDLG